MPLVDYESDEPDAEDEDENSAKAAAARAGRASEPPAKKRRVYQDGPPRTNTSLPPLPQAFHDQYASTVRLSNVDIPSLHQGRKRVNPHVPGNWPSHLYVEWHPKPHEHELLSALVGKLQKTLKADHVDIFSFLTSDLGAPQPLHISLSRPVVLSTAEKDDFLERLVDSVHASGIHPFDVHPHSLAWHQSPDSNRSFLVLSVRSGVDVPTPARHPPPSPPPAHHPPTPNPNPNPQLASLLTRLNALAASFDQPPLYQLPGAPRSLPSPQHPKPGRGRRGSQQQPPPPPPSSPPVDPAAFHVSLAWSFAPPGPALAALTDEVFAASAPPSSQRSTDTDASAPASSYPKSPTTPAERPVSSAERPPSFAEAVAAVYIRVDGVKAKIGNVVTHVPLQERRGQGGKGGGGGVGKVLGVG